MDHSNYAWSESVAQIGTVKDNVPTTYMFHSRAQPVESHATTDYRRKLDPTNGSKKLRLASFLQT